MPPKKTASAAPSRTPSSPQSAPSTGAAPTSRKPWVKKTPVEVVLEQIHKQEQKVAEMREEINHEERELSKLQQAKKVLESA
jgi:flagellar biosynthesis GTPase FlhF